MAQLVKFMRSSQTSVTKIFGASNYRTFTNSLRSFNVTVCKERQQRCLLIEARYYNGDHKYSRDSNVKKSTMILGPSLAFLGFFEKEEEPPLITTLKRSILLIQKGEFKKAEQMLHLALREAQTIKNEDGITYVYDVMANLAFDTGDFDKAEKLFKVVMQRVLSAGTPQDDLKIVHMSLKMAKILEHKRDYLNAENGYQYCVKILKDEIDKETEDLNVITLWAICLDWYGHLMLNLSKYVEASNYIEKAYEICVKLNGECNEQSVVLLNDLGSISCLRGNFDEAIAYLTKAAEIGKKLPEMEDIASIHINLGNVYMKKGLLDEAKRSCLKGWKLSQGKNDNESLKEAKVCLDEVNKLLIN